MGTSGSFPGVKRPGHEADHSPKSRMQYTFMPLCSVKAQGQLYLLSLTVREVYKLLSLLFYNFLRLPLTCVTHP